MQQMTEHQARRPGTHDSDLRAALHHRWVWLSTSEYDELRPLLQATEEHGRTQTNADKHRQMQAKRGPRKAVLGRVMT
jgi:hypothetical protein